MQCKCGGQSVGRELVTYYKRRDGTLSKYVQIEKRCLSCIQKSKRKKPLIENKDNNYAY